MSELWPVLEVTDERLPALAYLAVVGEKFFRHGSSHLRLVVDPVPADQWEKLPGTASRRYPEGDVKVERVCHGVIVEWVRERS